MISKKYLINILNNKNMKQIFNKKIINYVNKIDLKNLNHNDNQFLFRILSVSFFLKYHFKK